MFFCVFSAGRESGVCLMLFFFIYSENRLCVLLAFVNIRFSTRYAQPESSKLRKEANHNLLYCYQIAITTGLTISKMRFLSFWCTIILFNILSITSSRAELTPIEAAVVCVGQLQKCSLETSKLTKNCLPGKYFDHQNLNCRLEACKYCQNNAAKHLTICVKSWVINNRCKDILPTGLPESTSSATPSETCYPTSSPSLSLISTPTASVTTSPTATVYPSSSATQSATSSTTVTMSPSTSVTKSMTTSISPSLTSSSSSSLTPSPWDLPDDRAAAECVSLQQDCPDKVATDSLVCHPRVFVKMQPSECLEKACLFCKIPMASNENICKESWAIQHWCKKIKDLSFNAICVSEGKRCSPIIAISSYGCVPFVYVVKQSEECKRGACEYCKMSKNAKSRLCTENWAIKQVCGLPKISSTPKATVSERGHWKSATECTWIGNGETVVIPMARVKPFSHWTKTAKGDGIIWRANRKATWIDPSGSGGLCFRLRVPKQGTYYLTALTAAPHKMDHNDMWVNFTGGVDLFRAGNHVQKNIKDPFFSFKAYQNAGNNRVVNFISTVDHNPHIFVTKDIQTTSIYKLCISGRSSKFTVLELVMVHCSGDSCKRTSKHIQDNMKSLAQSRCV